MKKILLILTALTVSAAAFAEKITTVAGITSGNKYYIGATTSSTDYYFYVDGSSATASIKGVAKEDVADAVALTFTEVTGGWTIQFDNGLYLGLKNANDNGKVQVKEDLVVWTIEEDTDKGLLKLHPNDYYLQKNNSGTQFGSYKASQTNVWLESAGSTPVLATLDSLVIKGKAEKMEYELGEAFDPAGLEVWGIYTKYVKNDSTSLIKSGITWTLEPETFEEASDNASVTMVASYKELTTADTTITGIKVNAVVPKMDKTFDFTTNLYGHKGVSSSSGTDGDIAVGEKFNEDPAQIEFTVNGSTQTRFWDASGKHELRLYKGATFNLSVVGDYKIIKVEFTGSAVNLTGNGVTVSGKVWEGDAAKSVKFVNTTTGSKINSIKVTYIAADPAAANPTITSSTVADVYWEPITVTLACATEGADIYYTLDGSEPTDLATKYTAPFSVSATTTVKAIAIKNGLDNSEVVSKTFTFGTFFTSLEELVEKQPATEVAARVQVTITDAVIDSLYVTGKGYTNGIYVTAANTVVELYTNDVPSSWEVGGKVSGTIIAEWLLYRGTPELQKWEGGWSKFTYTAPVARKEFVFVAGEAADSDPAMFAITWGADGSSDFVKMSKKEDAIYVGETLSTVDSVVLVRCATGATEIIWDGEGKNVWNQTANYPLSDTMYFGGWVEDTNLFILTSEPPKPVEVKYYAKNNWDGEDWTWKEMTKSDENVYTLDRVVFGGTGVNINTKEEDADALWFDLEKMTYVNDKTIQAKDTVRFDLTISQEDTVLTATLLGRPAPVARKEFVFVAGEAADSDPAMFAFTWGIDGSNDFVKMSKKEDDIYVGETLPTVDSVVLVRCATGATDIIWDGEGKNVWNQTANYPLSDTMYFGGWVEDTNLFILTSEPPKPAPKVDKTGIIINGRKYGFPVRLVKEVKQHCLQSN